MTGTTVELGRLIPDYIKSFTPYLPSRPDKELMAFYKVASLHRLNNNENPLGPSPEAARIIKDWPPGKASLYPSGDSFYLRQALARRYGFDPDQILFGDGANEVISFAIKAFCEPGDNIVTADRTFAVYEWVAEFSGFQAKLIPLKDFGFDDQGMLEAMDSRTKILFVCNPNNPTGTWWDEARMRRFLDEVAGRAIVVIDEAYFEFVDRPDFPNGMALIRDYPNLIVFRTFSKMFGLAGLRIGYLAGSPEVVDVIRRTCVVYSVNGLAQDAALAALKDADGQIARTREHVAKQKEYLVDRLRGMGLQTQFGEGCFVMAKLPMSDTLAYRQLMARGVMIRTMTGFRFPDWIRISIGRKQAMIDCMAALEIILREDGYIK